MKTTKETSWDMGGPVEMEQVTPQRKATSRDGITVPPAVHIVDNEGSVWGLGFEIEHGGHVVIKDGKKFLGAGVKLVWQEGNLYLQNMPGSWFVLAHGQAWLSVGAPRLG
jgi:hypothetical protein